MKLTLRPKVVGQLEEKQRQLEIAFDTGTQEALASVVKEMKTYAIEIAEERISERHGNTEDHSRGSGRPYVKSFKTTKPEGQRLKGWKTTLYNDAPDAKFHEFGIKPKTRFPDLGKIKEYARSQGFLPPADPPKRDAAGRFARKEAKKSKRKGAKRAVRAKVSQARLSEGQGQGTVGPLGTRHTPDPDKTQAQVVFLAARSQFLRGMPALKVMEDTLKEFGTTRRGFKKLQAVLNQKLREIKVLK